MPSLVVACMAAISTSCCPFSSVLALATSKCSCRHYRLSVGAAAHNALLQFLQSEHGRWRALRLGLCARTLILEITVRIEPDRDTVDTMAIVGRVVEAFAALQEEEGRRGGKKTAKRRTSARKSRLYLLMSTQRTKTWPWWPPQLAHTISVRVMPHDESLCSLIAPGMASKKAGPADRGISGCRKARGLR